MFEVTKNETHVTVSVKLKKRIMAKESKVYLYSHDALAAAKKELPEAEIVAKAEKDIVVSNVSGPLEATWKFPLKVAPKQPVEMKTEEPQEEKKQLKIETRRARLERLKANKQDSSEEEE